MKKILSILVLLFFWCEINAPAQQIITATVTITNVNGTANGETILINSTTRTWTNTVTTAGTQILTATNIPTAATNLFLNYAVTPEANVTVSWNSSNVINFQCYAGSGLIASISSGWATISFSTNTLTQAISVRVPPSAVGNYEQSNVESGLAQYISDNKGTNTVGTNAPMFLPWYNWISSLWAGLTNFNGTNINSGTITTNSLDQQIYNLLFGGSPVSSIFIPGLEIQYEAGTNSSGGAFGTGFTNWVTTNQSLTLFGPATPSNSHAAPFWNLTRNYDGSVLASMDAEGVWDFIAGNFGSLTVNNLPVGAGGGGGGSSTSGSVGSLYYVNYNPTNQPSYSVSNVVISATASYLNLNGTYTNDAPSGTQTISFNGANYTIWNRYTNSTLGSTLTYGLYSSGGGSFLVGSRWVLYSGPTPNYYEGLVFNFFDPTFNSFWYPYSGIPASPTPILTPQLNSGGSTTNSTVIWQFGDNWYFAMTGTTNFNLSLAQDWKATNAAQVEYHKIFLNSQLASTLLFTPTNLWLWQNRQGLAANPPSSILSNETITVNIAHVGGNTNWLATWETTTATSTVESGYSMPVASINGATNYYWLDFGHQNPDGGNAIYASLLATNQNTEFIGLTNVGMWDLLSVNIDASGLNSTILVPDSWPHFNTNGWTHVSPFFSISLTNLNELRLTIQTNANTLSTTWQTFGQ